MDTMVDFKTKADGRPNTIELGQSNGPSTTVEASPSTINGSSKDIIQHRELEVAKFSDQSPVPAEGVAAMPSLLNLEQIAAQGMQFLATAPPEVLGGVLVGATAVSYVIFGRLALFIAGTLVGAIVHSAWETHRRRNDQHDAIFRWRLIKEKGAGDDLVILKAAKKFNLASLPPGTAEAMDELTSAIVRDYVKHWYTPLLPSEENFPNSCKNVLSDILLRIYSHVSQKRPTDSLLTFLISTSNILIVFFRELSTALGNGGLGSTPGAAIATYMEDSPSSALSQLLDQDLQRRKYKLAAEDILQTFVERKVMECNPVRIFLHEILAEMILPMTVDKFSEADWINEWIIYFLDEVVPGAVPTDQLGDMTKEEEEGDEIQEIHETGTTEEDKERERRKEARKSKAEEDLQQAMREAEELTRMIEEEERRKKSGETMREDSMTKSTSSITSDTTDRAIGTATPLRSRASSNVPSVASPSQPGTLKKSFTSFDQIVATSSPTPSTEPRDCLHNAYVTIMDLSPPSNQSSPHRPIRSKPMSEYMLQIEPHSSYGIPGWIVTRKYPDFETLHEVLIKLAIISGAEQFALCHSDVPNWKGSTKEQLRQKLETYLNVALRERALAQYEGMKKFLEKEGAGDQGGSTTPGGNALSNLTKGWANPKSFKKVGDNVLEALTKGPQGAAQAAQGGKAFFEGVFGGVGVIRRSQVVQNKRALPEEKEQHRTLPMGVYNPPKAAGEKGTVAVVPDGWVLNEEPTVEPRSNGVTGHARDDAGPPQDNQLEGISDFGDWIPRTQPPAPSESRNGLVNGGSARGRQSIDGNPNRGGILSAWRGASPWRAQSQGKPSVSMTDDRGSWEDRNGNGNEKLTEYSPPPPMDMRDDFFDFSAESFKRPPLPPRPVTISNTSYITPRGSVSEPRSERRLHSGDMVYTPAETSPVGENHSLPPPPPPRQATQSTELAPPKDPASAPTAADIPKSPTPVPTPSTTTALSEQETQFIIEILFAILNELFTLSSAWLLRRSLLNVAKNILLRPGNTSLDATRSLIQETLIESNSSDEAIAGHIRKLRKGVFPTPGETKSWEEKVRMKKVEWSKRNGLGVAGGMGEGGEEREYDEEEREERKEKARRLLLEKGMPEALKGVMGQQACRECLGKVFDCLQVKSVARGLMGGIVLEAVRGVCQ
ncbi:PXA domain-containing protein [Tirmania nivea]|nr:PXA domain-containing protein [Tirmania nivea]